MKCNLKPRKKGLLQVGASLLIAATVPFLVGCASHNSTYTPTTHKLSAAQLHQNDVAALRASGVQVIHLGETYRLVIPSNQLFNPASANLTPGARHKLNKIARLLNSYHIVTVRVAAYTDNWKSSIPKDVLTQRQASVVQSYLSDRGLKARLIYADGQGPNDPVAWNHTWAGKHANRRVEISFMYIPKTTIFM